MYPLRIAKTRQLIHFRFTKQHFEGFLLPTFAPELARQRVIAGEGGRGGGRGPRPLTPAQELCIALAFYASGRLFNKNNFGLSFPSVVACEFLY